MEVTEPLVLWPQKAGATSEPLFLPELPHSGKTWSLTDRDPVSSGLLYHLEARVLRVFLLLTENKVSLVGNKGSAILRGSIRIAIQTNAD